MQGTPNRTSRHLALWGPLVICLWHGSAFSALAAEPAPPADPEFVEVRPPQGFQRGTWAVPSWAVWLTAGSMSALAAASLMRLLRDRSKDE